MDLDLINKLLMIIGLFNITIFILVSITSKTARRSANIFLAIYLFCLALFLSEMLIFYDENYLKANGFWVYIIYGVIEPLSFIGMPCLYLYVRSLTQGKNEISRTDLKHAVWFFIAMMLYLPLLLLSKDELIKLSYIFLGKADFDNTLKNYVTLMKVIWIYSAGLITAYLIACFNLFSHYQSGLDDVFANTEKLKLQWLKFFLYSNVGMFIIGTSLVSIPIATEQATPSDEVISIVCGLMLTLIIVIGFRGLFQTRLFDEITGQTLEAVTHNKQHQYQHSSLNEGQALKYKALLEEYMYIHKPYLDSELTLVSLAEQLKIKPYHHLSQVINLHFSRSFRDFINQYRVEEAKRQLIEYPHKTTLNIALNCGFNSASTFYKAFKTLTQLTPKEYQAHMRVLPFSHEGHSI